VNYSFTLKSGNAKTGPIPVTYSPRETCPRTCPYLGDGCYAEAGFYTRMHWDALDAGTRGISWDEMCSRVAGLPDGTLWRHNIAGDLPHENGLIDIFAVRKLVEANAGKRGFTFAHHDMEAWANPLVVTWANLNGFTINLSCDSPQQADEVYAMNIGPVVLAVPSTQNTNFKTPAGRTVVICPATQREDVTCHSCGLCAVTHRETIVGFPAHGGGARKVDAKVMRFYKPHQIS
jgi:hypothetical protein